MSSDGGAVEGIVRALIDVRSQSDSAVEGLEGIVQALEKVLIMAKAKLALAKDLAGGKTELRVMLNGCFDLMHAGHYNALRQAKAAFKQHGVNVILVAGVHSDEAIMGQKGPTVMKDEERRALVSACKWVDEVAFGLPYLITPELLDEHNCDFVVRLVDGGVGAWGVQWGSIGWARESAEKRPKSSRTTLLCLHPALPLPCISRDSPNSRRRCRLEADGHAPAFVCGLSGLPRMGYRGWGTEDGGWSVRDEWQPAGAHAHM
jgi:cytidyltransferase-like protein